MDPRIYADHNATSPLRPEAKAAMREAMDYTGNPSSVHTEGRKARAILEKARAHIAHAIAAKPTDIVFTSGGTEAANLGVFGIAGKILSAGSKPHILISALEHEAVRKSAEAITSDITELPVTPAGVLCLDGLQAALTKNNQIPLLCLTLANNETGVIQPVQDSADLIHAKGGYVFCDGVQGLGKIPIDVFELGVDAIGFSAHKVGGPQGAGAVWFRPTLDPTAHMHGGGQEGAKRSGTHNVIGIAGFGAATCAALGQLETETLRLTSLRDILESDVLSKYPQAKIIGQNAQRLPNTACFAPDDRAADTRIIALDLAGIAASAGSACSSGKARKSPLVQAMGHPEAVAKSAIRISLGYTTMPADIDYIIQNL